MAEIATISPCLAARETVGLRGYVLSCNHGGDKLKQLMLILLLMFCLLGCHYMLVLKVLCKKMSDITRGVLELSFGRGGFQW